LKSIFEAMISFNNDYSAIERVFASRTRQDLCRVTDNSLAHHVNEPISVVICSFNGHRTLSATLTSMKNQRYQNFEVILVDDGSWPSLVGLVSSMECPFPITVVRLSKNCGLCVARNVGAQCAEGTSVVFLDDDMIVQPEITYNLALRQTYTSGCIFLGFREDVPEEVFFNPESRRPGIDGDWRFQSEGEAGSWVFLAADQTAQKSERNSFALVAESANFKRFGGGRVIGFWDLPGMVCGHSICAKRADIIAAGGFAENLFNGWGIEDLAFGALMAAQGHFIVPALEWVSFHLCHEGRKVPRTEERKEMQLNFKRYLRYIQESVKSRRFPNRQIVNVQSDAIRILEVLA
jgi:glycosyltransferase involved in cell wall biosynthesis